MLKAKEARQKAIEFNDTLEKEIVSSIEQACEMWYFYVNRNWVMSKEVQENLELYWYTILRMTKRWYRIYRNKS